MSSSYLFDTDVVINLLRGRGIDGEFIDTQLRPDSFDISIITYGEYFAGTYKSQDPTESQARFETFILDANVNILPLSLEAMRLHARIYPGLRKIGIDIGINDSLIASTALALNRPIVTNNVRHYARVPGLKVITPSLD